MVEMAIASLLLVGLLFGIIDFSNAYNNYNAVRQGVREGARRGVVGQLGTTTSCDIQGAVADSNTQKLICLTKQQIGFADKQNLLVRVLFEDTNSSATATYENGDGLIVCAQYPLTSITGLYSSMFNGKWQRSKVEMNIETPASGGLTAFGETTPGSTNWDSWCTATSSSP